MIAYARRFLDDVVPLVAESYRDATGFRVTDGQLQVGLGEAARSDWPTRSVRRLYRHSRDTRLDTAGQPRPAP